MSGMVDKYGRDLLASCAYCGGIRSVFCEVCGAPLCALCDWWVWHDEHNYSVCSPFKKLECRATIEAGCVKAVQGPTN